MSERYLVLGYANYGCKDRRNYEMSLRYFGYNYKVVGDGEKWVNFIDNKIGRPLDYLKSVADSYDIVIFTDVFDVMACASPKELIAKFLATEKRVCMGMENACYPQVCIPLRLEEVQNKLMKYVNSGFYIGYVQDVVNMWETMITYGDKDDQRCVCRYINENPELFHLDIDSEFAANIHWTSKTYYAWNKEERFVFRKDNGKKPCFLHFPGPTSYLGWYVDDYGQFLFGELYQKHTLNDQLTYINTVMKKNCLWQLLGTIILLIVSVTILIYCVMNRKALIRVS